MPDETRETAFPDDSRNAMEESPGNAADDLSRLFADTPGKGENPVPASPRRRPGRRVPLQRRAFTGSRNLPQRRKDPAVPPLRQESQPRNRVLSGRTRSS